MVPISDIAALVIKANADFANAIRALDDLDARIRRLSGQTVSIKATADTSAAIASLDNAARGRTATIQGQADTGTAAANLDNVARNRTATIRANLTDQAAADAELARIARDRTATVHVNMDSNSAAQASRDLDRALSDLSNSGAKAGQAISGLLIPAIVAIAPAVVPLTGALLGLGGAMVSSFGSAALALVPFAASIFGTYKSSLQLYQTLQPLNDQLALQQAKLATLTPGSKAYATQQAAIASTQAKINQAMSDATPVQQKVAQSMANLKDQWQVFQKVAEKSTGPVLTQGFQLLASILPKLQPLIAPVAQVFSDLLTRAQAFVNGNGFDKWIQFLVANGVPNLRLILDTVVNLFKTIGNIIKDFAPQGLTFTKWIDDMTAKMAAFTGGGMKGFFDYLKQNGPAIKDLFSSLGTALANITKAMADMGPFALTLTGTLLKLLAGLPPSVLQAIADGFIAIKVAIAACAIMSALIDAIAVATRAWAVAVFILDNVMFGLDITLGVLIAGIAVLVIALAAIAFGIYELVTHWTTVWNTIKQVAADVWGWLKANWQILVGVLTGGMSTLITLIVQNWSTIWNTIKQVALQIWQWLQTAWSATVNGLITAWNTVSQGLISAWNTVWNALKAAGQAIWSAIQAAWQAVCSAFTTAWNAASGALTSAWNTVWNALKAAGQAIWTAIQAAWQAVCTAFTTVWNTTSAALTSAWNTVWNALKTAGQAIWTAIQVAWKACLDFVKSTWDTVSGALKDAWNTVWGWVKKTANDIWDGLKKDWQTLVDTFKTIWDTFSGTFEKAVSDVWNTVHDTAKTIWNTIADVVGGSINGIIDIIGGIIDAWNTVTSAVGLSSLNIGKPGHVTIPHMAEGGPVSGAGTGTSDSIPAMLSHGEYVMPASTVNYYGVDAMNAIRARGYAAGGPVTPTTNQNPPGITAAPSVNNIPAPKKKHTGLFGTGIGPNIGPSIPGAAVVGDVLGAVSGFANSIKGWVLGAIGEAVIRAAFAPFNALIDSVAGNAGIVGKFVAGGTHKVEDELVDLLVGKDKAAAAAAAAASGGGALPSGALKAAIDQALTNAGLPVTAANEAMLNTLVMRESGGNPNAINLTDSNAAAGHPSQGLAQLIPSTFAAFNTTGGSILDPVANLTAALNYIKATYGSLSNVQQANASLPPKGYWNGTDSAARGWAMVGEKGPEWVRFHGGEKVKRSGQSPDGDWSKHGGSGGWDIHENGINIHVHGNVTSDALPKLRTDISQELRMQLMTGAGRR